MKKIILTIGAVIAVSFLGTIQSVTAHHSFAMFDVTKEQIVIGRVQRWAFNNPHTWLYIEVEDEQGNTQTWGFEGAAQVHAMRQGVNGNTFSPGEMVKVIMLPLNSVSRLALCALYKKKMALLPALMMAFVIQKKEQQSGWKMVGWILIT